MSRELRKQIHTWQRRTGKKKRENTNERAKNSIKKKKKKERVKEKNTHTQLFQPFGCVHATESVSVTAGDDKDPVRLKGKKKSTPFSSFAATPAARTGRARERKRKKKSSQQYVAFFFLLYILLTNTELLTKKADM